MSKPFAHMFSNVEMASNQLITDLNKDNKLNEKNYDTWQRRVILPLTGEDLTTHLTQKMEEPIMPDHGYVAQHCRNLEAYNEWLKKYLHAHIIMLSCMNDDLLGEYHVYSKSTEIWDQLKFPFGGISTTRLRSLVLKFDAYRKDPKHSMTEHLRMMSSMIRDLGNCGNALTDEQ